MTDLTTAFAPPCMLEPQGMCAECGPCFVDTCVNKKKPHVIHKRCRSCGSFIASDCPSEAESLRIKNQIRRERGLPPVNEDGELIFEGAGSE